MNKGKKIFRGPSEDLKRRLKIPKLHRNIAGAFVRSHRENKSLSLDSLLDHLAKFDLVIDKATLSRIETGERMIADYELLIFSLALNVPLTHLLGRES